MIRSKLWQILQHILRIGVTAGLPVVALWQVGLLDSTEEPMPQWIAIGIGALLGGFVSTPANNIGILVWEILALNMKMSMVGGTVNSEESLVLKELEYKRRVRKQRKENVFKLAGRLTISALIPTLFGGAMLFVLSAATAIPLNPHGNTILLLLGIIGVAALALAAVFGVATAVGIKSFHHQQ